MEPESVTCPWCQASCRPTARMCPSCGIDFKNWMATHPDKPIAGWTGPQATATATSGTPQDVPVPEASPASGVHVYQPRIGVPPPPARETVQYQGMESAQGEHFSYKTAAAILFVLSGINLLAFMVLSIMESGDSKLVELKIGSMVSFIVLGLLGGGALKGWVLCVYLGCLYYVLDLFLSLFFSLSAGGIPNVWGLFIKGWIIVALFRSAQRPA